MYTHSFNYVRHFSMLNIRLMAVPRMNKLCGGAIIKYSIIYAVVRFAVDFDIRVCRSFVWFEVGVKVDRISALYCVTCAFRLGWLDWLVDVCNVTYGSVNMFCLMCLRGRMCMGGPRDSIRLMEMANDIKYVCAFNDIQL